MVNPSLISLFFLAAVHLIANRLKNFRWRWNHLFLSFASGISLAYVLVDLLPALEKGKPILKRTLDPILPYLHEHTYVIALLGALFYHATQSHLSQKKHPRVLMSSYLLFNLFIGAALSDPLNYEIQPLILFTIAIGLHYFIRDILTQISNQKSNVWLLISALFAGYFIGYFSSISDVVIAAGVSFIAGGILLNTFQYELPRQEKTEYVWFTCGALLYTAILLLLYHF